MQQQSSHTLRVEVSSLTIGLDGYAKYNSTDCSLTYDAAENRAELYAHAAANGAWRQAGSRIVVMVGFLTLIFEGVPSILTSLDAYTNSTHWMGCDIVLPELTGSGALALTDERVEDDRLSITGEAKYDVDRERKILRIGLGRPEGAFYFEVGSNLVAGLRDAYLQELIFTNVTFD